MSLFEYGKSNMESPGKLESIKVKVTCNRELTSPDAVGQLAVLLGLGDNSVKKAIPELVDMKEGEMIKFLEPTDTKKLRYFNAVILKADKSPKLIIKIELHLNGFEVKRPNRELSQNEMRKIINENHS